jgi:hypothetical protein
MGRAGIGTDDERLDAQEAQINQAFPGCEGIERDVQSRIRNPLLYRWLINAGNS